MMTKKEIAGGFFSEGYNCSQAVIAAFSEMHKLDENTALKLATGLGSGMRVGSVCGVVSGAIIVIGLLFGNGIQNDATAKEKTNKLVEMFIKRFENDSDSIYCKDILNYDVSKEEELAIIKEKSLFTTICPDVIGKAIDILEEILEEES